MASRVWRPGGGWGGRARGSAAQGARGAVPTPEQPPGSARQRCPAQRRVAGDPWPEALERSALLGQRCGRGVGRGRLLVAAPRSGARRLEGPPGIRGLTTLGLCVSAALRPAGAGAQGAGWGRCPGSPRAWQRGTQEVGRARARAQGRTVQRCDSGRGPRRRQRWGEGVRGVAHREGWDGRWRPWWRRGQGLPSASKLRDRLRGHWGLGKQVQVRVGAHLPRP